MNLQLDSTIFFSVSYKRPSNAILRYIKTWNNRISKLDFWEIQFLKLPSELFPNHLIGCMEFLCLSNLLFFLNFDEATCHSPFFSIFWIIFLTNILLLHAFAINVIISWARNLSRKLQKTKLTWVCIYSQYQLYPKPWYQCCLVLWDGIWLKWK